jgi:hypothetical protein
MRRYLRTAPERPCATSSAHNATFTQMSELCVPTPVEQVYQRSPLGTFSECPHCAGEMRPEHAHYRCAGCGWRDSCCD